MIDTKVGEFLDMFFKHNGVYPKKIDVQLRKVKGTEARYMVFIKHPMGLGEYVKEGD